MLGKIFNFNGAECTKSYMKNYRYNINTFFLSLRKKLFGKVQSCSRSSDSTVNPGVNCLVIFFIFRYGFSFNIRRQGS